MPVAIAVTIVFFIWSLFASIPAISTGSPTIPNLSFFSLGFEAIFILVGILTFIGIILFVIAMHRLSGHYNEPGIFKNALYGFILNIVGSITAAAIEFAFVLRSIGSLPQTGIVPVAATPTPTIPPIATILTQLIFGFIAVLAVGFILGIISAVFYMRAFNNLAEKSGVDNFKTAGLLYLLGTVLTIMLIGGLLVWIAWIFAATGFNSLKRKEPSTPSATPFPAPAPLL